MCFINARVSRETLVKATTPSQVRIDTGEASALVVSSTRSLNVETSAQSRAGGT